MSKKSDSQVKIMDLEKLKLFDTIHDFWKGERNAVSDKIITEKIQNKIVDVFADFNPEIKKTVKTTGNASTRMKQALEIISNSLVTPSSIEDQAKKFMETNTEFKSTLLADKEEQLTYEDIVIAFEKWDGTNGKPPLWHLYSASGKSAGCAILKLKNGKGQKSIDDLNKGKKFYILADFIVNYYFPELSIASTIKTSKKPFEEQRTRRIYFTFDAGGGDVKKIFGEDRSASQIITPANIADSAGTKTDDKGVKSHADTLKNRKKYVFPYTNKQQNDYTFNSNLYTQDDITMKFENNGYNDKNVFGFEMILNENNKKTTKIEFNEKKKQGPSVNYLIDLTFNKNAIPEGNVIHLNSLYNDKSMVSYIDKGLLFDFKRAGDHEQANSAKMLTSIDEYKYTIFSTLDILCSVYARTLKQNSILVSNGLSQLTLYRFHDNSGMSEKQIQLQNLKYKTMDVIDKLSIFEIFINENLQAHRMKLYNTITLFLNNGAFLNDPTEKIEKHDKILTLLIKIKLYNLLTLISNLRLDDDAINNAIDDILKKSPDVNKVIGELFTRSKQETAQQETNTNPTTQSTKQSIIGKLYSKFKSFLKFGSADKINEIIVSGKKEEKEELKRELAFVVSGPIFKKIVDYLKQYVENPDENEMDNVNAIVTTYSKIIAQHADLFKNINRNFNILNSDCLKIDNVTELLGMNYEFALWENIPETMTATDINNEGLFTLYDDNKFMQFNKFGKDSSSLKMYIKNAIIPLMKLFVSIQTRLKYNRGFRSLTGKGSINPNATQFYNQLKSLNYDETVENFITQSFHVSTSYDNSETRPANQITGEQIVDKLTNILALNENDDESWYDNVLDELNNYYNNAIIPALNENIRSFQKTMSGGNNEQDDDKNEVDAGSIDVEFIENDQEQDDNDNDSEYQNNIDVDIPSKITGDYSYLNGWDDILEDDLSKSLDIINEETDTLLQLQNETNAEDIDQNEQDQDTEMIIEQSGGSRKSRQGIERYAKTLTTDEMQTIERIDAEQERLDKNAIDVIYNELGSTLRYISTISAEFIESYITDMIHASNQSYDINDETSDTLELEQNIPEFKSIIASLTRDYNTNPEIKDNINAISNLIKDIWMKQIVNIHEYNFKNYPVDPVEFYISVILSIINDETGNTFEMNSSIIGDFQNYYATYINGIRRALKQHTEQGMSNAKTEYYVVQTEDIVGLYKMTDIPAPILTLLLFTLIDNYMQVTPEHESYEKKGYFYISILKNITTRTAFKSSFFDTQNEWNRLPDYIIMLYRIIFSENEEQRRKTINEMIQLTSSSRKRSSDSSSRSGEDDTTSLTQASSDSRPTKRQRRGGRKTKRNKPKK